MELQGNNFGERLLEARKEKNLPVKSLRDLQIFLLKQSQTMNSENDTRQSILLQDLRLHLAFLLPVL